ncbi:MAG: Fe-S cluster assembly protein HesB [Planctomycetota bacterium]
MPSCSVTIPVQAPFELRLCLFGHGWVALAPHEYDEATATFTTVLLRAADGDAAPAAIDAELTQATPTSLRLQLGSAAPLTAADKRRAAAQVVHMLRLDDELAPFHAMCAADAGLAWAARRGAGRLLRSATMVEDLMKLLVTTNTSWAATVAMTRNLVAAAGSVAPSSRRAFPTPRQCRREEAFYRDVVRAGYRADAALRLAQAFDDGTLDDAHFLEPMPSDALWRRLLALHGFGPYAAGQAMRLCGHYDRLALDSWCRARLAEMAGRSKPSSDRTIERRYACWAPYQGLALWLDLTADWHGEGPHAES